MLNATRTKYDAYTQQIGKLNNVADPSRAFEVLPAIAQTLRAKLKGSSDFLSKINIIPVVAQEGDKVGVGVKGTIASRTDTRTKDRSPRYPGDLDETRYRCEKTNFDTLIRYETLDAWAHQPNFQTLLRDARKAAARRFAEAGCSNQEIKAWTGHTTDSEVARYTAAADQRTLSDTAADKLLANLAERLAKDVAKALKSGENK